MDDSALYLEYNGLFNDDPSIAPFLARTAPGFENTQTVAPTGVTVSAARARSLVLTWTPISFDSYNGGYTIFVSTSANGPFSAAVTTPDKLTSTFTLDGLEPSTDYFVRIATSTYSTPDNKNTVTSDPSPVVATRTTSGAPAPASVVVVGVGSGIYQEGGTVAGTQQVDVVVQGSNREFGEDQPERDRAEEIADDEGDRQDGFGTHCCRSFVPADTLVDALS